MPTYIIFLSFDQIQFSSKASKSDKTFYAENKKKPQQNFFRFLEYFGLSLSWQNPLNFSLRSHNLLNGKFNICF